MEKKRILDLSPFNHKKPINFFINKNVPVSRENKAKHFFLKVKNENENNDKNNKIIFKRNENEKNQHIIIKENNIRRRNKSSNKKILIRRGKSSEKEMPNINGINIKINNNDEEDIFKKSQTLRKELFIEENEKNKDTPKMMFVIKKGEMNNNKKKIILKDKNFKLKKNDILPNINVIQSNQNNFNNLIKLNNHNRINNNLILRSNPNFNRIINEIKLENIIKDYYNYENQNSEFRKEMEDYLLINQNFLQKENHKMFLFCIFDGHGGKEVAEYLKNNYENILRKNILQSNYKIEESLNNSFLEIDSELNKNREKYKLTGSTATIILIDNNLIYCANVGDSSCFYISNDKIIRMTKEHNVKNEKEVERIKEKGGLIFKGKVFGTLSLTRAIGDFDLKDNGVIANPTISKHEISKNNSKFVVLASDGIWDAVSKMELFRFSKNYFNSKDFCTQLVKYAIDKGTMDNISCIVIHF